MSPYDHVKRKMRPYPGCERGRESAHSATAAVHQAMKLLPGPGKPEGKENKRGEGGERENKNTKGKENKNQHFKPKA